MNIIYSKQAVKTINGLDSATKQRIKTAICQLPDGDVKPLKGYTDGRQRLRVGKYRIVFRYIEEKDETTLFIMEIGSRGDIYK